jgi:hypothetical protein
VTVFKWNPMDSIFDEVRRERYRQDEKWGPQRHPLGTGSPGYTVIADLIKEHNDKAMADKTLTWAGILREEFYESMAETDPKLVREELLQTMAVACHIIEAIDAGEI